MGKQKENLISTQPSMCSAWGWWGTSDFAHDLEKKNSATFLKDCWGALQNTVKAGLDFVPFEMMKPRLALLNLDW